MRDEMRQAHRDALGDAFGCEAKSVGIVVTAKRGDGSTAKPASKKYPPPLSVRLTYEEREFLLRKAGRRALSAYVRDRLFDGFDDVSSKRRAARRKPALDSSAIALALGELGTSKLAMSLQDVSEAAKSGTLPATLELLERLEQACTDIAAMRKALIAALGLKSADSGDGASGGAA